MSINFNPSINDISKILSDTDKLEYWKGRLAAYKNSEGQLYKNNLSNTTLFGLIQQKADLTDLFDYVIRHGETFWNDSIQALIEKELNLFNYSLFGGIYTIDEIRNGDAGFSFVSGTEYVKPWTNPRGVSYSGCRLSDLMEVVVTNDNYLHFTEEQETLNSIRLLMPQNKRRVEVEDLNRNFWVISDISASICEYLFSNDGLKGIIEDLITELGDIWENILYLWVAAGLLATKEDEILGVHCEVLYVPNNPWQPYKKYDHFDNWDYNTDHPEFIEDPVMGSANFEKIKKSIEFLKKKYRKYDLCILPCIRYDNYEHNHYRYECYPFVYLYDRAEDKEDYIFLRAYYGFQAGPGISGLYGIEQPLTIGVDLTCPAKTSLAARTFRGANWTLGKFLYGVKDDLSAYYYPYNRKEVLYNSQGEIITDSDIVSLEPTQQSLKYDTMLEVKPILWCVRNDYGLTAALEFNLFDVAESTLTNNRLKIAGITISSDSVPMRGTKNTYFGLVVEDDRRDKEKIEVTPSNLVPRLYKGELISDHTYSSYLQSGSTEYDTKGLKVATQGTLLKIGGYFPDGRSIGSITTKSVEMQATIDSAWKSGPLRETLDSAGKRTGYKCNLTIGAQGTTAGYNSIVNYFIDNNGQGTLHDASHPLNPVSNASKSVFLAQQIYKTNDVWKMSFARLWSDVSKVKLNEDYTVDVCGLKGLSAQMSQKYLQYAFESSSSSPDHLDKNKINYIITAIGVSSWLGGYANAAQGYQGYWSQNILCHYVRYVPIAYLNSANPPTISYSGGVNKGYPIIVDNAIVGYIDNVVPMNKAEGFVGNFPATLLKENPAQGSTDKWRLPQLNASNKTSQTIYKVYSNTTTQNLVHYNEKTRELEILEVQSGESSEDWYVTKHELGLDNIPNPTQQQVSDAIVTYVNNGGHEYTAQEILSEYTISGIWNLFDGYTTSTSGNKTSYVGGNHTQVLQLFFAYDSTNNKFVVSNVQGTSRYRNYNSSSWTNYTYQNYLTDGSLGQALPQKGYIYNGSGVLKYVTP